MTTPFTLHRDAHGMLWLEPGHLRVKLRRTFPLGTFLLLLTWGCGGADLDPEDPGAPAPDGVEVVPPRLAPPPARDVALDRDGALHVAQRHADPSDAILELDAHRFEFALDEPALEWFGAQGVEPQVLDYLSKRARVDWESLRGDVDPDGPR